MSDEIVWKDPPPIDRGSPRSGRWKMVTGGLQERPGAWALVGTQPNPRGSGAQSLRKAGCEVTVRKNGDGWDVYARWPEEQA